MRNIVILCMFMSLTACGCETVSPGNVGVELEWNHPTGKVYGEGTHFVGPTVDLHEMTTRLQSSEQDDIVCRSHDNVQVTVDVTVGYTLNRTAATKVFQKLGDEYVDLVVVPALRSSVRDAVASVDALAAAQSRSTIEDRIADGVRRSVAETLHNQGLPTGSIRIDNLQLRNVDLPDTLRNSIESIQRQRNAAAEREQALVTARQEAERARVEAEGHATVQRIQADAQANFNRVLSASLTPGLIELRRIEAQRAVVANPNAHLVVVGNSSAPVILQAPGLGN